MARADVGDDVYDEDPTVNCLQELAAEKVAKEACLFVASGTMGNLIAILVQCGRGGEMILGKLSHVFQDEVGGAASLGGIHAHNLHNEFDETIPLDVLEGAIREEDIHQPRTRLICLENTHNRCGGTILSPDYCDAVGELARNYGVAVHLDGARLFNAAIALGVGPDVLTRSVDSVMFCLSKGLGCPVGSLLCGSMDFIHQAKRIRKMLGGGMRQVGILAAAGMFALEHHVERLAEDHKKARWLAEGIGAIEGLTCGAERHPQTPETNLVYFHIDGIKAQKGPLTADSLAELLLPYGILARREGRDPYQMRMVTHLDVTEEDIDITLHALHSLLETRVF